MYKSEKVEIVDFNHDIKLPNYVYYYPDNDEISVGYAVKNRCGEECNKIYDCQKFIGLSYYNEIVQEGMKEWPFKIINDNGIPKVELEHNKRTIHLTATDITSEIVKYLKYTANKYCANNTDLTTKAVITYPFHFTENQKLETKISCEKANIEVIDLIPEPLSAIIAYLYSNIQSGKIPKHSEYYLVYNFTKSRFDVTICNVDFDSKTIKIVGYDADLNLGGDDIDNALVDYYLNLYLEETGKARDEIKAKTISKLQKICEATKCLLSAEGNEQVTVDWEKLEDYNIDNSLSRTDFNKICVDIFNKTMNMVDNVLKRCKLSPKDISNIILSGQSSTIPIVKELLKYTFDESTIYENINPSEVCAYGATIYANIEQFYFKIENDLH